MAVSSYDYLTHIETSYLMQYSYTIVVTSVFLLLIVALPVLAQSDVFKQQIDDFSQKACVQKSKSSSLAALCSTIQQVQEINTRLDHLVGQVEELKSNKGSRHKALKVFDANGVELGFLVDRGNSQNQVAILRPPLDRVIVINPDGGDITSFAGGIDVFYPSNDCSGAPYAAVPEFFKVASEVFPDGNAPEKYYLVTDPKAAGECIDSHSEWQGQLCSVREETICDVRPLTQVTLPFTAPVAVPLQYNFR